MSFAEWIQTVNGVITLISGLVGLIGTGIGVFFAIKNWVALVKQKSAKEVWAMIQSMADAAMQQAEKSMLHGDDKKKMVIEMVKESAKASGLNIDDFMDQLSAYIDQTISFVNGMTK